MQSVSIIGIGRLGGALAIAMTKAGFPVRNLVHRSADTAKAISHQLQPDATLVSYAELPARIDSDLILITTPDPEIRKVAETLRNRIEKNTVVLHTSGSMSSEVLVDLATEGNSTGSLHPLVSVNEATKGADHFANAYFCIEGDETALGLANSVATRLGGIPFTIRPTEKALYHAAAVTACGHLVALIDVATEMLSKCGIERRRAQEILLPLISTTVRNLESSSPAEALTGSFARMDIDAVRRHLAAIDDASLSPAVWAVYITLGERSLDLAEANGAEASEVAGLRDFISMAKRKCG